MFTITKGTFTALSRVTHIVEALYDEMQRDGAVIVLYAFREDSESKFTFFRFLGKKEDVIRFLTVVEERVEDYLSKVEILSKTVKLDIDES